MQKLTFLTKISDLKYLKFIQMLYSVVRQNCTMVPRIQVIWNDTFEVDGGVILNRNLVAAFAFK